MNRQAPAALSRFTASLDRAGEWFNPLLVKECRQSLKSRQFFVTFTLVVVLSWLWTIYGIVMLGPDVAYSADGAEMFYGYYLILAFPLLLIVPYSAYRSFIEEREDNTFELVAITTLRPRQIVGGKLGSAMAQMLVYLSVVAPCLAFTYMLRGVDVLTICWILFYTVLASLGLSLMALLMATIAKERHWQVMASALIVVELFYSFSGMLHLCYGILRTSHLPFQSVDFWIWNLKFLTAYWSSFALVYLAAGAMLTSAVENRSTPLRVAMFVQQTLLAGWIGFDVASAMQIDLLRGTAWIYASAMIWIPIVMMYWFAAGALMLGEATEISSRARRSLPTSFLGRVFSTWFNPGPDTGFLFAVSNGIAAVILAIAGLWIARLYVFAQPGGGGLSLEEIGVLLLPLAYLIIYLGIGNILFHLLLRVTRVTLATSAMIEFLILLLGMGIPQFIRYVMNYRGLVYTLLNITDPFWTCFTVVNPNYAPLYLNKVCWIVLPTAVATLFVNLIFAVPAVRQVRIAPPRRVEEEDAERLATLQPQRRASSPWTE